MDTSEEAWNKFLKSLAEDEDLDEEHVAKASVEGKEDIMMSKLLEMQASLDVLSNVVPQIMGEVNQMKNQGQQAAGPQGGMDPNAMMQMLGGAPEGAPTEGEEESAPMPPEAMGKSDTFAKDDAVGMSSPSTGEGSSDSAIAESVGMEEGDTKLATEYQQFINTLKEAAHKAVESGRIDLVMAIANATTTFNNVWESVISPTLDDINDSEVIAKSNTKYVLKKADIKNGDKSSDKGVKFYTNLVTNLFRRGRITQQDYQAYTQGLYSRDEKLRTEVINQIKSRREKDSAFNALFALESLYNQRRINGELYSEILRMMSPTKTSPPEVYNYTTLMNTLMLKAPQLFATSQDQDYLRELGGRAKQTAQISPDSTNTKKVNMDNWDPNQAQEYLFGVGRSNDDDEGSFSELHVYSPSAWYDKDGNYRPITQDEVESAMGELVEYKDKKGKNQTRSVHDWREYFEKNFAEDCAELKTKYNLIQAEKGKSIELIFDYYKEYCALVSNLERNITGVYKAINLSPAGTEKPNSLGEYWKSNRTESELYPRDPYYNDFDRGEEIKQYLCAVQKLNCGLKRIGKSKDLQEKHQDDIKTSDGSTKLMLFTSSFGDLRGNDELLLKINGLINSLDLPAIVKKGLAAQTRKKIIYNSTGGKTEGSYRMLLNSADPSHLVSWITRDFVDSEGYEIDDLSGVANSTLYPEEPEYTLNPDTDKTSYSVPFYGLSFEKQWTDAALNGALSKIYMREKQLRGEGYSNYDAKNLAKKEALQKYREDPDIKEYIKEIMDIYEWYCTDYYEKGLPPSAEKISNEEDRRRVNELWDKIMAKSAEIGAISPAYRNLRYHPKGETGGTNAKDLLDENGNPKYKTISTSDQSKSDPYHGFITVPDGKGGLTFTLNPDAEERRMQVVTKQEEFIRRFIAEYKPEYALKVAQMSDENIGNMIEESSQTKGISSATRAKLTKTLKFRELLDKYKFNDSLVDLATWWSYTDQNDPETYKGYRSEFEDFMKVLHDTIKDKEFEVTTETDPYDLMRYHTKVGREPSKEATVKYNQLPVRYSKDMRSVDYNNLTSKEKREYLFGLKDLGAVFNSPYAKARLKKFLESADLVNLSFAERITPFGMQFVWAPKQLPNGKYSSDRRDPNNWDEATGHKKDVFRARQYRESIRNLLKKIGGKRVRKYMEFVEQMEFNIGVRFEYMVQSDMKLRILLQNIADAQREGDKEEVAKYKAELDALNVKTCYFPDNVWDQFEAYTEGDKKWNGEGEVANLAIWDDDGNLTSFGHEVANFMFACAHRNVSDRYDKNGREYAELYFKYGALDESRKGHKGFNQKFYNFGLINEKFNLVNVAKAIQRIGQQRLISAGYRVAALEGRKYDEYSEWRALDKDGLFSPFDFRDMHGIDCRPTDQMAGNEVPFAMKDYYEKIKDAIPAAVSAGYFAILDSDEKGNDVEVANLTEEQALHVLSAPPEKWPDVLDSMGITDEDIQDTLINRLRTVTRKYSTEDAENVSADMVTWGKLNAIQNVKDGDEIKLLGIDRDSAIQMWLAKDKPKQCIDIIRKATRANGPQLNDKYQEIMSKLDKLNATEWDGSAYHNMLVEYGLRSMYGDEWESHDYRNENFSGDKGAEMRANPFEYWDISSDDLTNFERKQARIHNDYLRKMESVLPIVIHQADQSVMYERTPFNSFIGWVRRNFKSQYDRTDMHASNNTRSAYARLVQGSHILSDATRWMSELLSTAGKTHFASPHYSNWSVASNYMVQTPDDKEESKKALDAIDKAHEDTTKWLASIGYNLDKDDQERMNQAWDTYWEEITSEGANKASNSHAKTKLLQAWANIPFEHRGQNASVEDQNKLWEMVFYSYKSAQETLDRNTAWERFWGERKDQIHDAINEKMGEIMTDRNNAYKKEWAHWTGGEKIKGLMAIDNNLDDLSAKLINEEEDNKGPIEKPTKKNLSDMYLNLLNKREELVALISDEDRRAYDMRNQTDSKRYYFNKVPRGDELYNMVDYWEWVYGRGEKEHSYKPSLMMLLPSDENGISYRIDEGGRGQGYIRDKTTGKYVPYKGHSSPEGQAISNMTIDQIIDKYKAASPQGTENSKSPTPPKFNEPTPKTEEEVIVPESGRNNRLEQPNTLPKEQTSRDPKKIYKSVQPFKSFRSILKAKRGY